MTIGPYPSVHLTHRETRDYLFFQVARVSTQPIRIRRPAKGYITRAIVCSGCGRSVEC